MVVVRIEALLEDWIEWLDAKVLLNCRVQRTKVFSATRL